MIKSIAIRNYALIQELDLSPSTKLSMITGETGAGKSIMLGALGLLMGRRADTKVLWDDSVKCDVEATFDIEAYRLKGLFEKSDLDYESETIIRREIAPSGKSRAFINDTPVTLDTLKNITSRLMDIHSQHESLQLGANEYQLHVVDSYADHSNLISAYLEHWHAFEKLRSHLANLERRNSESQKDQDYNRFVLGELVDAHLDTINQEELENELNLLENVDEIKTRLDQSEELIDRSEVSISNQFRDLIGAFNSLRNMSADLSDLAGRIDSLHIELRDILNEIIRKNDQIVSDPERKEEVEVILNELNRLQHKHHISDISGLRSLRDQLASDLMQIDNLDEEIKVAREALEQATKQVQVAGLELRVSREKAAGKLGKNVEEIIHQIGIENGVVRIQFIPIEPSENGMDECQILFSANKGIEPRELKDVASGGEFSRLIFALKFLIADKIALPTIIFDEIDTGVSGEIALKMVRLMKRMAENHQIISISHLPQFAAGGDAHFFVYKDHSREKSVTKVKELIGEDRIQAIAQMIGGDRPSETAFDSARELMTIPA